MKCYLKWVNKYSGEVGYVGKISTKNQYFINSEDAQKARRFRSEKEALKAIDTLTGYGEADNNDFSIENDVE